MGGILLKELLYLYETMLLSQLYSKIPLVEQDTAIDSFLGITKFDVTRALSIFTLFFISQWFPVFIYIFKNILDTLSCSRVLNFLQIIIVFSFCFIIVRIGLALTDLLKWFILRTKMKSTWSSKVK